MLHLLENMVAVPVEKAQKHKDGNARRSSLKEYCSPLVTAAWQQMMADQSECLILICVKIRTGKGQKGTNRKKCAKWQLKGRTATVANKKGGE